MKDVSEDFVKGEGIFEKRPFNALVSLRVEKGMNQFELAKETGYSQAYISQLESGKREITETVATRLAKVLEMPVKQILDGGYRNYLLKQILEEIKILPPKQLEDVRSYIKFVQYKAN